MVSWSCCWSKNLPCDHDIVHTLIYVIVDNKHDVGFFLIIKDWHEIRICMYNAWLLSLRTYYFVRWLCLWVRKGYPMSTDLGEVAINSVGETEIVITCWCIFMMHIYSCMDILAVGVLGIMWKISYYWCMCMSREMTTWYV